MSETQVLIARSLVVAIARLLRSSWHDIDFKYDGLTDEEKRAVSHPQFLALVKLVELYDPQENG